MMNMGIIPGFLNEYQVDKDIDNHGQTKNRLDIGGDHIVPQGVTVCSPVCLSVDDEICAKIPGIGRKCVSVPFPGKFKICHEQYMGECCRDTPFGEVCVPCPKTRIYPDPC